MLLADRHHLLRLDSGESSATKVTRVVLITILVGREHLNWTTSLCIGHFRIVLERGGSLAALNCIDLILSGGETSALTESDLLIKTKVFKRFSIDGWDLDVDLVLLSSLVDASHCHSETVDLFVHRLLIWRQCLIIINFIDSIEVRINDFCLWHDPVIRQIRPSTR